MDERLTEGMAEDCTHPEVEVVGSLLTQDSPHALQQQDAVLLPGLQQPPVPRHHIPGRGPPLHTNILRVRIQHLGLSSAAESLKAGSTLEAVRCWHVSLLPLAPPGG